MKEPESFTLANGLQVYVINNDSGYVTGWMDVNWAPRDEEKGKEGISHFLEHVIWNSGSKNLPSEKVREIRNKFGRSNAATSKDRTYYYGLFFKEEFENFLYLLSEVVLNNQFEEEIIQKEKKRVLRETFDKTGNAEYRDMYEFKKNYLGETIHNRRPLGFYDAVEKMNRDDLISHYENGYAVNNMKLILVGTLPENYRKLVEKYFSGFEEKEIDHGEYESLFPIDRNYFVHKHAEELLHKKDPEQSSAQIYIEYTAPQLHDADFAAMDLIQVMLGGNGNSRLHKKVSRDLGLAYSIAAQYICRWGHGQFYIYTKVKATEVIKVLDIIMDVIDDFILTVSEQELETAKQFLLFKKYQAMDSNTGAAMSISESLASGLSYKDYIKQIKEVDLKTIKLVAENYLKKNKAILIRDPLKRD